MATLPISKIIHKHDTEANWQAYRSGYVPAAGEIVVYDRDESRSFERIKIGDGVTTILNLPFISDNEVYIGAEEPTEGQRFWIDTDEENAGGGASGGITMEEVEEYVGDQLTNYSTTSQMQYYVNANTRKVYAGPTTLYVDPDHTLGGDSTNTYSTFRDVANVLSGNIIDTIITINFANNYTETGVSYLTGILFNGLNVNCGLIINGNGATLTSTSGGVLVIRNCIGGILEINNLNLINTSTDYTSLLYVHGPVYIKLNQIVFRDSCTSSCTCIDVYNMAKIFTSQCAFYSSGPTTSSYGVFSRFGCECLMQNNRGNCDYFSSGSHIFVIGTVPSSTDVFNQKYSGFGQIYGTDPSAYTVDKG